MRKKSIKSAPVVPSTEEPPGLRADQYEVLVSSIRGVENTLASMDRDFENDRRDMQDFKVRLGTLEEQVKQLRESVNLNAQRTKDKVADVVEPMKKEVSSAITDLTKAVEKKRVLVLQSKGFFARLFRK